MSTKKIVIILFSIALVKAVLFSHLGFGLLDEGESLQNAVRILNGALPYKDFFAIFPPFDNYIFALIFKFFGVSVLSPRIVMSFIFSFSPPILFLLIQKYFKTNLGFVLGLILIFLDLNVERLYFFTPILLSVLIYEELPFVAGLLIGMTSLIRFDLPGVYLAGLFISLFFYTIYAKKSFGSFIHKLIFLGLGYVIPVASGIFWLVNHNLLSLFIKSAFVDSIVITKLHHLSFPSIWEVIPTSLALSSLSKSYEAIFANSLIATYVLFLFFLIKNWKKIWKETPIIGGLFFSGIFALPYVFGRSDVGHIIKGGISFLIILVFLIKMAKNKYFKIVGLLYLTLVLMVNLFQGVWWSRFNNSSISVGGYNLRLNSNYINGSTAPKAETVKDAVAFLQQSRKDEKVLALPYMAGIYFLSDRMPPNKFNNVLSGFVQGNDSENKFIEEVKSSNVKYIVYDSKNGPKMKNNTLKAYNPIINKFILENYEVKKTTEEGWFFMERKNE